LRIESIFSRSTNEIMKSKLDGVGVAHADQHATPQLRTLMVEAQHAPMPGLIIWAQTAHERFATANPVTTHSISTKQREVERP
jgi:hypothetical protein